MKKKNCEKEYLMIKEEIMYYYSVIHSSRNILYVALGTILTYALSSSEPMICLVPYCVIIPVYIVTIDYQYGMWRMGTYLSVFLEGKDFNWETRLHKLNTASKNEIERHASSYQWPFIICGLCCSILFFMKIDYKNLDYKTVGEILFSILLTIGFLIFVKNQKKPDDIISLYMNKWNDVKNNGVSNDVNCVQGIRK